MTTSIYIAARIRVKATIHINRDRDMTFRLAKSDEVWKVMRWFLSYSNFCKTFELTFILEVLRYALKILLNVLKLSKTASPYTLLNFNWFLTIC
jgi:hypothetical protein